MTLLCTVQEVKDRLTPNISGGLPTGLGDPTITDTITSNQDAVVAAFGVTDATLLSTQRQSVAKAAIIRRTVADLLVIIFPTSEAVVRMADNERRFATQDVDRCIEGSSGADKPKSKLGVSLV